MARKIVNRSYDGATVVVRQKPEVTPIVEAPKEPEAPQALVRVRASELRRTPPPPPKQISKSDFIRSLPDLSPGDVVSRAAAAGIGLSAQHVSSVRSQDARRAGAPVRPRGRPRKGDGLAAKAHRATAPARPAPRAEQPRIEQPRIEQPRALPQPKKSRTARAAAEKELAHLLLSVGLNRAEELLAELRELAG
jgi:hypothetical protein